MLKWMLSILNHTLNQKLNNLNIDLRKYVLKNFIQ